MTRRRSCPLRLPSFATWCASPSSSGLYHGSVDRCGQVAVLEAVAEEGLGVVEIVYPEPFDPAEEQQGWSAAPESDASIVEHVGTSGVVLAFDQGSLVAIAERVDVVIELVPQVGDFVARGDPLFRVRSGGRPVEADALRASVAIGPERTMEQDPRFAFRILVDIANKALSPGINDPTTAVLALDQIHRLLMYVGKRRLDAGQSHDAHGRLRLCYRTPDWIDFVSLSVTEIRHYGASSMQVAPAPCPARALAARAARSA